METLDNLKYPIGKFQKPNAPSNDLLTNWISDIENFPDLLKAAIFNLSDQQLLYRYRPNGWTILQVIHHCADSHMQAYIRIKLAYTQVLPAINPYDESQWAQLFDVNNDTVSASILLLEGLHCRWAVFLKSLSTNDLNKAYYHPANNENVSIETAIGLYAWHCNHHLAHIKNAVAGNGNF